MFFRNIAYQDCDRTPVDPARQKFGMLPAEPEVSAEKNQISDLQREDLSVNYAQENGFFKGVFVALPFCIEFWVIFILGIKALNF